MNRNLLSLHVTNSMFFYLLISIGVQSVQAYQLPDTGQTKCYGSSGNVINCPAPGQPLYGQDAQYNSSQPSYRNNGDGTVVDLNTGLVWQQNGGNKGNYQDARYVCEGQLNVSALGGHTDWRVPSRRELVSIVDYGHYNPAININNFQNNNSWWYWSSSSYVNLFIPKQMWTVDFSKGAVAFRDMYNIIGTPYIRCVSGNSSSHQFIDNGNNTVTDTLTGLTWQKQGYNKANWQESLAYCEGLSLGNQNDWRLPNIRELETIVDYKRYNLAIDPVFQSLWLPIYWSSTTQEEQPGSAWIVNFDTGLVNSSSKNSFSTDPRFARCVRGGISGPTELPNLIPYQPPLWSNKIVVSKTTGTNTDSVPLTVNDTLYLDFSVANVGNAPIVAQFRHTLYIDGVEKSSWISNSLQAGYYTSVLDYSIGKLSKGTHQIKIVTDSTNVIKESNELDNSYTKTITVTDSGGKPKPWLLLLLN